MNKLIRNIISKIKKIKLLFFIKYRNFLNLPEIDKRKLIDFISKVDFKKVSRTSYMNNYTVSIIIPCYNHEKYLEKTFESLISQTRKPDEIIFVNDKCEDNTLILLKQLINKHSDSYNFKIINNIKNMGQSESLNIGIAAAMGNLIMLLNDDDYLFYDSVEAILKLFELNKNIYMIGGTSIHFKDDYELDDMNKYILNKCEIKDIKLTIKTPSEVIKYNNFNDINMTHSGCTFYKYGWECCGKYYKNSSHRLVPFSDRDFQLRFNAVFPIGISSLTPLSFWRMFSSVDAGLNT